MNQRQDAREFATKTLREHFETEAADAGLRSLDLASVGGGSRSPDGAAVGRVGRKLAGVGVDHGRVRKALQTMTSTHVELLSLAYGCRLRTRDTEDGKHRKALRQSERNWRVRFAEAYGADGMVVLASPKAKQLYASWVGGDHPDEAGFIRWLLDAGRAHAGAILSDARRRLDEALDVFAVAYGYVPAAPAQRRRSDEKTRSRILAFHAENGHEIGR